MEAVTTATSTYPTSGRMRFSYEGSSGALVVGGAATDTITVVATLRLQGEHEESAGAILRRVAAGIRQDGDRLSIVAPRLEAATPWFRFGQGARIDYAVTLPHAAECRVVTRSGRVEVADLDGPVEIDQRSGRTTVRRIAAGVRLVSRSGATEIAQVGAVDCTAHSGKVAVREVAGDVRVHGRSGRISVERIGGTLEAHAQTGRLEASAVRGDARLSAMSGRIDLTECGGSARLRTASGAARFQGPVLGDLTIDAGSGAIVLDVDPAHPFFLDAESVTGSVRSDLPPRAGAPPPSGAAPSVRLRTVSGSIRIGRYVPLAAAFDDAWGDGDRAVPAATSLRDAAITIEDEPPIDV